MDRERKMIKLVAYHMTATKYVESILQCGLLKSQSNFWVDKGGCIYLYMSNDKMQMPGRVQLEVDITGLDLTMSADWEMICWEDIPPERIKVFDKELK